MQYSTTIQYEASRDAALRAIKKIDPAVYSRTRNFLDGAVTGLSPWITHGYTSVREAAQILSKKHALSFDDKLIFEFAWREFFKHVHGELGKGILSDIRKPVWQGRYNQQLPDDIREGRTGVKAIDEGVALLYSTGYLHNHIRMWIASYCVHMRKVHWRVGAEWMYSHLLDGDLASNHLSWQWVAGTFSHKPYVFNADNVKKYASKWDCTGTCIDTDYEDLESIARSKKDVGREVKAPSLGSVEPNVSGFNADNIDGQLKERMIDLGDSNTDYKKATPTCKTVQLIHPWDLGECFEDAPENGLRIGLIDKAFHKQHRWSQLRWDFVLNAMKEGCRQIWIVDTDANSRCTELLKHFNASGIQFEMKETLNEGYVTMSRCLPIQWTHEDRLLPNPARFQQSFSRFYREATLLAGSLEETLHDNAMID